MPASPRSSVSTKPEPESKEELVLLEVGRFHLDRRHHQMFQAYHASQGGVPKTKALRKLVSYALDRLVDEEALGAWKSLRKARRR